MPIFKVLGDMVNALTGGCAECGARENLRLCQYCRKLYCEECLSREVRIRSEVCKKNPTKGGKHNFLKAEVQD
ncbi:MAG: hypothetical protein D6E12_01255 [Desulfovibrio sp.]|nr:MAG: hypothetical protein D6E12_01255 [Desulfovibrio sp.]